MRKILLLFTALAALTASARDFYYTYEDETLAYTVLSEEEKTVSTKVGISEEYYSNPGNQAFVDHLVLPAEVYDGEEKYTLTTIGAFGFMFNDFTSVVIPNTVTEIGVGAFEVCTKLTSVELPESVSSIGSYAFGGCNGVKEISVSPANKHYISQDGIVYTHDLTEIVVFPAGKGGEFEIPHTVTSIGSGAFSGCDLLTGVEIPNTVTTIDSHAFVNCYGLTSLTIPQSVTKIDEWAFTRCTGLTSIEIPNTVTSIGQRTFWDCTGLTTVVLPESITSLGGWAFNTCKNLESMTVFATEPPALAWYVFDGTPKNAVIYVPKGTVDTYANTEGWNYFSDFREIGSVGVGSVETEEAAETWYDLHGRRHSGSHPTPGIYLKRQGDTLTKVLVK